MTRHNRVIQASKSWDGVYSNAGSLEATACDATNPFWVRRHWQFWPLVFVYRTFKPTGFFSSVMIRVAPNLTFSNSAEAEFGRMSELKFGRSRSRVWLKFVFWSQNNTPVIKLMASTMLSAAIKAVHFSASFVALLFASYW